MISKKTSVILTVFFTIIVVCLYFLFIQREKYTNTMVYFLTETQTKDFLRKDNDRYIRSLSSADLFARKAKTHDEYLNNSLVCVSSFSQSEQNKLKRCIRHADEFLRNFVYRYGSSTLNCNEMLKIPWKFAKTSKTMESTNEINQKQIYEYEEGFPHTRDQIIFLSDLSINKNVLNNDIDDNLINTLIHEKVHVYQRLNPKSMEYILKKIGYVPLSNQYVSELKRSNPDINNITYKDWNGKIMLTLYKSVQPSGINDVVSQDYENEHPYEKMAYYIANEYTRLKLQNINTYINIS